MSVHERKRTRSALDQCQTPYYALDPLLPYLPTEWVYWEPACGDGNIVAKLKSSDLEVIGTDILTGYDFFDYQPNDWDWDCQVTTPPYSLKYKWLKRSYELDKPFALLLPLETLAAAKGQALFKRHGLELILLNKRVNFKMPKKGWDSSAQFPVAWFTFGLNTGQQMTFGKTSRYPNDQLQLL